jgi:hypothetical protein
MAIKPVHMSYELLAGILRDIAERVESGDSYEGHISYLIPEGGGGPDDVLVEAAYRVGNTMGQGGMRIIGDPYAEEEA